MITFLIGLGCLLAAMLVGMIYTVETTLDFQAVQLWRMEWLVGAAVAFIAGILLKSNRPAEK
jgi:cytosine/uracil/thiamine/allantoin permease